MQGRKTHEQHQRTLERKSDVPDARRMAQERGDERAPGAAHPLDARARQSEFPVSRGGMNQESRDHNKHNHPGQSGHKRQRHGPGEDKR